jgi:hypothetical protein
MNRWNQGAVRMFLGNFIPGMPARTNRSRWLSAQAHQNLIGADLGLGDVVDDERFGAAMLVDASSFHRLHLIRLARLDCPQSPPLIRCL